MSVASRAGSTIEVAKVFGPGVPPQIAAAEERAQMTPSSPFSPGEPIGPYDGFSRTPRSHEFVTSVNTSTRPRSHERVSFETLKGLIRSYDVAQLCIRHRIASLRSLDWKLIAADAHDGDVAAAIEVGMAALKRPDRKTLFKPWLAKYLRGILSFDAGTLYRMRNRGGRVVGLKVVDGTCYSEDTEILTRVGWKRFADVDITRDEFATRNQKTRAFEWQQATHYTVQDWAGREPLYRFHSRSFDLLVTGNHRMLVTSLPRALGGNGRHGGESFVPAEDLARHFTGKTGIPATSVWTGTPITEFRLSPVARGECVTMAGVREARKALGWSQATTEVAAGLTHQTYWSAENGRQVELATAEAIRAVLGDVVSWEVTGSLTKIDAISGDDFAAFMGMWLSEGSLNGSSTYVNVTQQRGSKGYQEFRDLLTRMLGAEPSCNEKGWRFKSAALAQYLRQFGHAPDKFIPAEILNASAGQLAIFWRFYMLGDGCYDGSRQQILTASKRMADGLQEVAQKIGYQASIQVRRHDPDAVLPGGRRQVSPLRDQYAVRLRTSESYLIRQVDRVPYDGNVYCVSVPNETLYVRRNGRPAWCGNTIAPMMDYWGDSPEQDAPAYVQYINGLPWNWLTRADLIYEPYDPQDDSIYGRAPLEDILLNANTDIRFQLYFLQRFTEGNLPHAFASAPETWTPDQIEQFQEYWDGFMQGDQSRKHQIRWVPGGSSFAWSDEKEFTDHFSLFLMRKTCAAYSVVPSDLGFTESVNRSSGESQADVQHRVGDLPLAHHVMDILSAFLQDDLQLPLKFIFDLGEEQDDRVDQAEADDKYMKMGVISPSDIREMRYGLAEPGGVPVPRFIYTERSGPIPLSSLYAVAGEVDPATAAPAAGASLPQTVFGGTEGVLPNPPIKVMSLAEREFGPDAMPPAPPPQPVLQAPEAQDPSQVAKDGEGAPAAGITAETGLYSYDLVRALDDEEDSDAASVAKEMAAFRRYSKARRKGGEWRDFEFRAIARTRGHNLNDSGRAAVRKAAGELVAAGLAVLAADTGRVLMLQRALDEGDPAAGTWEMPGGHVEDGETALRAAWREWAEETGCMPPPGRETGSWTSPDGVYQGIVWTVDAEASVPVRGDSWVPNPDDPDGDSAEAIAWWDPETLPGNPAVRPELLASIDDVMAALGCAPGDPAEGDEATCPCGTPVVYDEINGWQHADGSISHDDGESVSGKMAAIAKARDARPKGWPGWKLDLRAAGYWQPYVIASAQQSLTGDRLYEIGTAYIAANPGQDGDAPGKRDRNAAALAWLKSRGVTVPMGDVAQGITADAAMIGGASAQAAVNGQDDAGTGDWEPGDSGTARRLAEALGVAAVLALMPAGDGSGGGVTADVADAMEDGYLNVVARVLAGWDPDVAADELADMLAESVADEAYAEALTVTQITTVSGEAAFDYYLANSVSSLQWLVDDSPNVCPVCLANERAGPIPAGTAWPSGARNVPQHPRCRCGIVPDWFLSGG